MRRVWWMAAVAVAVAIPAAARAAGNGHTDSTSTAPGAVTAVSVQAASGRAEVVIGVDGDVDVQDFVLDAPHRIVVDLNGATLRVLPKLYDGVVRAGITSIHVAQFKKGTVRVVLDLDREHEYKLVRGDHDVRVSLEASEVFEPWSLTGTAPRSVPSASVVPAPKMEQAPVLIQGPPPVIVPPALMQQRVPRVTVTFRDTPLPDVLAVFADRSGRTIVSNTAQSQLRVNAEIIDQPWDVALKSVLQSLGLAALEDQQTHIITVDSYANIRAQAANEPLVQQMIALNYAKASELAITISSLLSRDCGGGAVQVVGSGGGSSGEGGGAGAVAPPPPPPPGSALAAGGGVPTAPPANSQQQQQQQMGGSPTVGCPARGSVTFESNSNKLIITEVASRIDSLMAYVRSFDFKTQQVNIQAKFVSIDRTDTKRLGVSYDLGSANASFNTLLPRTTTAGAATTTPFSVNLGGDAFAGVANAGRSFSSAASSAINLIYNTTIGNFSLTSFIDALTQEQLSDITAQPSVNTLDKRTATLFVGDHIAFLLTPPTAPGAIQSAAPQISALDVGITLTVTPSISANRTIRLLIHAEQSTLTSITAAGVSNSKRNADVEVLVHDGETAVIAGLTQTSITKSRRGIPLLGDLPIIGKLFSENEDIETKNDLLLLITPHILDDPDPNAKGQH